MCLVLLLSALRLLAHRLERHCVRNIVLGPVGRNGRGLRVELDALLAVEVLRADKRATRAGERKHRQRNRNRKVDADLAHVGVVRKLARGGAWFGGG